MIKRILVVLGLLTLPLALGLLFTYDVIKIEWISMMEIQPSFGAQEDPLPLPPRSIPVQGAAYIPELGEPVNPVKADSESLSRGEKYYGQMCAHCHGPTGAGNGPFSAFLVKRRPANLLEGRPVTSSDGYLFVVISEGVPEAMPALRGQLPEPQMRWDVVNYLRKLQQP